MSRRRLTASRCMCRGCNEYFNSSRAFDIHRVGVSATERRCLRMDELLANGMSLNSSGFWITRHRPKHCVHPATSRISAPLGHTPLESLGGVP